MEKFENLAELFPSSGHSVQFYKEKTLEKLFTCETCNQLIIESDHLMVSGAHFHKHHFRCSVCNVNLDSDSQTSFFIRFDVDLFFLYLMSFNVVTISSSVRFITTQISRSANIAMRLLKRTLLRLWEKITMRTTFFAQLVRDPLM